MTPERLERATQTFLGVAEMLRDAAAVLGADATLRADLARVQGERDALWEGSKKWEALLNSREVDLVKAKEREREVRMSLAELARRFRERTTDEQRCHDQEFLWSIDEMLR